MTPKPTSTGGTASSLFDLSADTQADLPPSAEDKAEIPNPNEAAAPSCQPPCEERADSSTQPQSKKISPIRSLYKDYVYVDVGPSKQRFGVHKGLICHRSKFFDAAFNGSFGEASKGIVALTEEDPDLFDIVHAWLYTNRLTQSIDGQDKWCSIFQLVDVFVLADKLDMPSLCNKAIDLLKKRSLLKGMMPDAQSILRIYTITPQNSALRNLFVAIVAFVPQNWPSLGLEDREFLVQCPDFLFDVSMTLKKQITHGPASIKDAPFLKDPCSFHQHAEGEKDCLGAIVPRSGEIQEQ